MDHCISTLLACGGAEDIEIILVDDGSTDDTGHIADAYREKYPDIVRVIHQENGGHGEGVNQDFEMRRVCTIKLSIRMIGLMWQALSGC